MISIREAFNILQENLPEQKKESVYLTKAYSCYLAEDIYAPEPSPRYTNSAMDGYAVRWEDVAKASRENPAVLAIVGESQAGKPFTGRVGKGEAIRISTGAVLPVDTDTAVRVEDTDEHDDVVQIFSVRHKGQDVRFRGEEFQEGEVLLPRGTHLRTRQLTLLASVGIEKILVYSAPEVALLVTGTELVSTHDSGIKPFQIRDSNTIMLEYSVRENGGEIIHSGYVDDNLENTKILINSIAEKQPAIILCSGGVSVGRHDHVKKAAEEAGFTELFWRIKQKPGKPLFAARRKNTLLFGLPGNPVSAYMCYIHYVRPIMAYLKGRKEANAPVTAKVPCCITNKGKRTNFLRVNADFSTGEIPRLTEVEKQGSHMLSSITSADGYIIMDPGETLEPGSLKEVYLF